MKALVYDDALDAPNAGQCQDLNAELAFTTMWSLFGILGRGRQLGG